MLLHRLMQHPDTAATTLTAAYHIGLRDDIQMAVDAIKHPNAPTTILNDAATRTDPKIRIAWLSRPERTETEIVATLQKERRGDVLAALVPHVTTNSTISNALAELRKRPVALALIHTNPTGLSDTAIDALLATIDPMAAKLNYHNELAVRTFYNTHPEAVIRNADKLTSEQAHNTIITHPHATQEALQTVIRQTLADNAATHSNKWQAFNRRRNLIANITNHPNVNNEILDLLVKVARTGLDGKEREQVNKARERIATGAQQHTNIETVATTTNLAAIRNILGNVTNVAQHTELVKATLQNPHVTPQAPELQEHMCRAISDRADDPVAQQLVARYGDQCLIHILGNGYRTEKLAATQTANNPETARQQVILERLKNRNLNVNEAVKLGLIDDTTIGNVPAHTITHLSWIHEPQAVVTTEKHVTERLGDNVAAWEMFTKLANKYPGTLDELLDTTLAATS